MNNIFTFCILISIERDKRKGSEKAMKERIYDKYKGGEEMMRKEEKAPYIQEIQKSEKEQIVLYVLNDGASIKIEPKQKEYVSILFVLDGTLRLYGKDEQDIVLPQDVLTLHTMDEEYLLMSKGRSRFYIYTKNDSQKIEEIQQLFCDSKAGDPRDRYTIGHCKRVYYYAMHIAESFMERCNLLQLAVSSMLHDIGKLELPIDVLLKPGKLTNEEYEVVKTHSMKTYEKLLPVYGERIAYIASSHHEKIDGSGYPRALKGLEIPLEAKIIAVADVFDALTSRRPYREPMKYEEAIAFLEQNSAQFESEVVQVLKQKVNDNSLFSSRGMNERTPACF